MEVGLICYMLLFGECTGGGGPYMCYMLLFGECTGGGGPYICYMSYML